MAILDGGDEVGIGLDFGRQLVAHDLYQIVAGQQVCCLAVGDAFLGQEHQRDHDQCHVMMPGGLKGAAKALRWVRQVFTNKDGSTGILPLVCSDLTCDYGALL